jgi:hypothetical protein
MRRSAQFRTRCYALLTDIVLILSHYSMSHTKTADNKQRKHRSANDGAITWTLKQAKNGKFNFTHEDEAEEYIDWFIWEKSVLVEQRCSEPSAMDAELQLKTDSSKITVLLPRHRYGHGPSYLLEITTPVTPRRLIDEVYSFYQEAILLQDIDADEDDDYSKDARKRLAKGETVKRVELLGNEIHLGGSDALHRHPFLCSGLVRFEGLKAVQTTAFELILGS